MRKLILVIVCLVFSTNVFAMGKRKSPPVPTPAPTAIPEPTALPEPTPEPTPEPAPTPDPTTRNFCSILFPGWADANRTYCPEGFGVLQHGHLITRTCFGSIDSAVAFSRTKQACEFSGRISWGRCTLLYPGTWDKAHTFCGDLANFAVLYQGYNVNGKCYDDVDEAIRVMKEMLVCNDQLELE